MAISHCLPKRIEGMGASQAFGKDFRQCRAAWRGYAGRDQEHVFVVDGNDPWMHRKGGGVEAVEEKQGFGVGGRIGQTAQENIHTRRGGIEPLHICDMVAAGEFKGFVSKRNFLRVHEFFQVLAGGKSVWISERVCSTM